LANAITMSCAMGIIEGLCALQVPYWAAKVISAPIVMVINYFGYKIFVFGIRDEVKALSKKHGVTLTDDTIDCGQTIEMLDGFLRSQAEFDAKMVILWCGFAGVVARDKNLSGDGIFIEIMSCIDTLDERVISIKGEKARDFLNDLAQSKMKDLKPEDVSSAALYMFNVGVRL